MNKTHSLLIKKDGTADRKQQGEEITEDFSCEMCESKYSSHFRTVKGQYSDDEFMIERCNSCGLIYVSPRLNRDFRNFCYEHEQHLVDYFLSKEAKGQHLASLILDILAGVGCKGGNLLEVGCGIGTLLNIASVRGFSTTGIELNNKTASYSAKRHNVIKSDLYDVSLPASHFDVVIIEQTLEHLSEPLEALKKAYKLIKQGGYVFVGVPVVDWLVLLMSNLNLRRKFPGSLWSPEDHLFYFEAPVMQEMLSKAGFEYVDMSKTLLKWRVKKLFNLSTGRFLGRKKG